MRCLAGLDSMVLSSYRYYLPNEKRVGGSLRWQSVHMPEVLVCSSLDEELPMTEFVEMKIQVAVVRLAEELNYARASERLNIAQLELNRQITELENQLELEVFRVSGEDVEVTEAGQVFVNACRTFLATRSRQGAKSEIQD
jgi:hypothetical protein